MDVLTAFGLFSVTAMLVCCALEDRSHWLLFAFAGSCALGSAYGFQQGAWPNRLATLCLCIFRSVVPLTAYVFETLAPA
jgi:hypothetical protein